MLSIAEGLLIFIVVGESILGVLGNGFIGLVNCIDCVTNKKFSVIGLIFIGLATSRIFLIWIIITDAFIKIFSPHMYTSGNLSEYISYAWIIINHLSTWFASSLSTFYFLKIANFSHHCFLWLKHRIHRVLSFLMGLMLISWLLVLPQIVKIIKDLKMNNNSNTTWQFNIPKSDYFTYYTLLSLGVIFLFILCLVTCLLLIVSLWRHNRHMQSNALGGRDPSTEAQVKAIKILVSFIALFILHFIGIAIEVACSAALENKLLFIFGVTTVVIYPCGHSFILILGNSKLKQASWKVLQPLKCCGKAKPLGTPQPGMGRTGGPRE
ncbi:PREDICTED: taste receptor type 2 member 10 [Miniopterus natalensis]|uniref:taste receptor type 2 member 10 n=1 Tax=Miniopterus natalensis TaxID=291302 RepID=UPI0007A6F1EB|nr:PREDICTED: taste receptor type 2 member 10 [Miniopterus natalensis]